MSGSREDKEFFVYTIVDSLEKKNREILLIYLVELFYLRLVLIDLFNLFIFNLLSFKKPLFKVWV